MSKSKRSAEPPEPPEFFADRNLGKLVPAGLIELGWQVHRISEHFPDDAQQVSDQDWIEYGLQRLWVPLCKDGRIQARAVERQPLEDHKAVLFYLNNQQLKIVEMVARFHAAQAQIYRAARRGGPAAYAVSAVGIERKWP